LSPYLVTDGLLQSDRLCRLYYGANLTGRLKSLKLRSGRGQSSMRYNDMNELCVRGIAVYQEIISS